MPARHRSIGTLHRLGEPELLRRAVENVVRNAIRHAPDGTAVQIGLGRWRNGDDHGSRPRAGRPRRTLGAIFEPFFRVEGDRARGSGGVGLGLAIARRAVALHRGRITARNVDPGLLVEIVLPLANVALVSSGGAPSATIVALRSAKGLSRQTLRNRETQETKPITWHRSLARRET